MILPRPEGLPFTRDARQLGLINMQAKNRYRDDQLNVRGAGPKVEALIDQFVRASGIDPKVPPISILDVNFPKAVQEAGSSRAKASEMEHAARLPHQRPHGGRPGPLQEAERAARGDPQGVPATTGTSWPTACGSSPRTCGRPRAGEVPGLDTQREAPFYRLLAEEVAGGQLPAGPGGGGQGGVPGASPPSCGRTCSRVDFWRNRPGPGQAAGVGRRLPGRPQPRPVRQAARRSPTACSSSPAPCTPRLPHERDAAPGRAGVQRGAAAPGGGRSASPSSGTAT